MSFSMEHAEAIAPVLKAELWEQMDNSIPDRYMDWINIDGLACAVAASVAIPDRAFVDDQGRRWEWCGGTEGTWAWRVVASRKGEW